MKKIKYLVMDVDGTLTDGKIYMGQDGEIAKAFDIKDGAGIYLLLPKMNVIPVVITARESRILENRCKELNITKFYSGVKDKLAKLKEIVGDDLSSVAYIGDDLPDMPCMYEIRKADGIVLAPCDAIPEIIALANYVSGFKAGEGAVRDCINYLKQRKDDDLNDKVRETINLILAGRYSDDDLPNGSKCKIQEYMTKEETNCILESHRKHIDVQYIIEGHEEFKTYVSSSLTNKGYYNQMDDVELWQDGLVSSLSILFPGSFIVVYNGQPHKGGIIHKKVELIKKLVCKIEI